MFTMTMPKNIKERLKILAAERGLDMSAFIRQLIFQAWQEYLKRKGLTN